MSVFQGKRVRELREDKGLSQEELASLAGMANGSMVHRLETGATAKPRSQTVARLAEALQCQPEDFYGSPSQEDPRKVVSIMSHLILKIKAGIAKEEDQDQLFRLAVQHLTGLSESLTTPCNPCSGSLTNAAPSPDGPSSVPDYLRKLLEELSALPTPA